MTTNARILRVTLAGLLLALAGCGPDTADPVYQRCVTEQKTYCNRLFVCLKLGPIIGIKVNYEDESKCKTEETKKCDKVSTANSCPGGGNTKYDSAKHDQCIADQGNQSCAVFANRPSSCSTYCSTN